METPTILIIESNEHLREAVAKYITDETFQRSYPISIWNTTNVTDMSSLFSTSRTHCENIFTKYVNRDRFDLSEYSKFHFKLGRFNENIGNWDTSNVKNMESMFYGLTLFNQNISRWNTSNVTNMSSMFYNASNFNMPINTDGDCWNVSNVTNMRSMFAFASKFNQNISNWDVSKVTNMSYMFLGAANFNQKINSWNFNDNVFMENMFDGANLFLSHPENYIYNPSHKIESIIEIIRNDNTIDKLKKTRETLMLSTALQTAINEKGLSNTFDAVGDFIDFQNAGRRKTRKHRGKRRRNRKTNYKKR